MSTRKLTNKKTGREKSEAGTKKHIKPHRNHKIYDSWSSSSEFIPTPSITLVGAGKGEMRLGEGEAFNLKQKKGSRDGGG